jgi:hypothetical protein
MSPVCDRQSNINMAVLDHLIRYKFSPVDKYIYTPVNKKQFLFKPFNMTR